MAKRLWGYLNATAANSGIQEGLMALVKRTFEAALAKMRYRKESHTGRVLIHR
jgi:hypothetical protein